MIIVLIREHLCVSKVSALF